ncbi:alpha-glucosidase [Halalkalibacillus sediminis]|uniref:Alpha-glucosidase n=1 Tax=Halalkalibacillus sediminis TaxID=2018042 RepID=A0A2I0QU86_9BACI|nr:glycoside hydrolase family 31 protein [Halalkalibacillus sediminis]PKR77913.1 alpha-glucosidase [Halalkalibacillus sediminis]
MEDTSFAIHPGNDPENNVQGFYDIGDVLSTDISDQKLSFKCQQGYISVLFYKNDIVRIIMNPQEEPLLEESFAVDQAPENIKVHIDDSPEKVEASTDYMKLTISKHPFRVSAFDMKGNLLVSETDDGMAVGKKEGVICYKDANEEDHYFGFGEKSGFLDKRGEKLTMWNSDVYAPHNPETDPLYQSIPFFMTLRRGLASGIFFDNTYRTTFDMEVEQLGKYSFHSEGGQLDYYILAGPTPKKVVEQYTSLTGRMPLPPKWAIGYHQSRYSYESKEEVEELVRNFKEKDIPLDAVHFDIHYMEGYRVFTFDEDRFPQAKELIRSLDEQGVRVVPIVDPGVKADAQYSIYQEGVQKGLFCKYLEGNIFFGDVWPGKSAFPDFLNPEARKWWGDKHQFYTNLGIEGIWNDMNEPAVFNETKTMDTDVMHRGDKKNRLHIEVHNVYGNLMAQGTYEGLVNQLDGNRPFLLTRAGYSGIQRYAAVWTGDNRSFWEHLEMAIPMCLNLGASGVPFSGADIGGFAHDSNGELLARWTQLGVFTPYFRNHSALGFARQEPWAFGEKYEKIISKYIKLRYRWMQHMYKLFKDASETGVPVMRPMYMEYPSDQETYKLFDQFMIGESVLVAPILRPGIKDRLVYLPEGTWYDYWTDETFEGSRKHIIHAELDQLPIFIKQGAVIPELDATSSTAKPSKNLTVHVYPGQDSSSYKLYEDDGRTFEYNDGKFFECELVIRKENGKLDIQSHIIKDAFQPTWELVEFVVHSEDSDLDISFNDQAIESKLKDKVRTFGVEPSNLFNR